MERNLSERDTLNSLIKKVASKYHFNLQIDESLLEIDKNFSLNQRSKKTNLVFFGDVSVGKTTLVNLVIRHLIAHKAKRINTIHQLQEILNQQSDEEEDDFDYDQYDGFVRLTTTEMENTYFFCFVENSDSEAYEVILEVNNEEEREALLRLKELKNKKFDDNNKIIFKYSDDEHGIKSINNFLININFQCQNLIRRIKRVSMDYTQCQQETIPSKIIIKIPDFPKELRLIDSPALSNFIWRKHLIKVINDLDSLNIFLLVNDIFANESYSITDNIIREISTDFDSPILYSFVTKGINFLKEFPKINKDYKSHVRIKSIIFKYLDQINPKVNFRKLIPINENVYDEDVKNSLDVFFNDLNITKEKEIAKYETSVMLKLRSTIINLSSQKKLLNQLSHSSVFIKWTHYLLTFFDKYIHNFENTPTTNYKEEFLNILGRLRLKNFFRKVFDYEEAEVSD